jgi:hypothetical protein
MGLTIVACLLPSDRMSPRTFERRVGAGRVSINLREGVSLVTDRSP